MAYKIDPVTGKQRRGFASMAPEKRLAIARKGGAAVPSEKRSFSRDPELAVSAGRKGGSVSRPSRRSKAPLLMPPVHPMPTTTSTEKTDGL